MLLARRKAARIRKTVVLRSVSEGLCFRGPLMQLAFKEQV